MDYAELTAQRLKLAMESAGFNQTSLARAWKMYNAARGWKPGKGLPVTRKTIGEWLAKGIPVKSVKRELDDPAAHVAAFFHLSKEQFLEETEDWSRDAFQAAVRAAFQISSGQQKEGVLALLTEVAGLTERKNLERIFDDYHGMYYAYLNWIQWKTVDGSHKPRPCVYKMLISIDAVDPAYNVIRAKLTTRHIIDERTERGMADLWGYHGVIVPVAGTLYCIFESTHRSLENSGFVFMTVSSNPHADALLGLLTAQTTEPVATKFQALLRSFPASSRVIMTRISKADTQRGEAYLLNQLGYFRPEEIDGVEHGLIEQCRNDIKYGVLTIC